jgi:catabolite regulation protein CreA
MKAVYWYGTHKIRVENVSDPKILNPAMHLEDYRDDHLWF